MSLSKVVKAGNVRYDNDRRVNIEVMDLSLYMQEPQEVETTDHEEEPQDQIEIETIEESADEILECAKQEASDMISNAKHEASKIIEQANAEAERLASEAFESKSREGYDIGYKEGLEASEKVKADAQRDAQLVIESAMQEKEKILKDIEPQVVELIIALVEKLIKNAAAVNSDTVLYLIREGLSGATLSGDITVRVSRHDYQAILDNMSDLLPSMGASAKLEVINDSSLSPSDCVIETPLGDIDCSLDQQFQSLKNELCLILKNREI